MGLVAIVFKDKAKGGGTLGQKISVLNNLQSLNLKQKLYMPLSHYFSIEG
jgi:hypothetical protein